MKRKAGNRKRGKLLARKQRVARGLGVSDRTRLTVYRSARHIYAQLVNDDDGRTLVSACSIEKDIREAASGKNKIGGTAGEAAKGLLKKVFK